MKGRFDKFIDLGKGFTVGSGRWGVAISTRAIITIAIRGRGGSRPPSVIYRCGDLGCKHLKRFVETRDIT